MPTPLKDVLARLDALGSEKVRAISIRHGAGDDVYGVKMGDIRKVAETLRKEEGLVWPLWETGNFEARLLALLLLKPARLSRDDLDRMVREADAPQLADWVNAYVVKDHPATDALRAAWMDDRNPWAARAGWSATAGRIARRPEGLDLPALLDRIEREMPHAPGPAQWTMNTALANIGIHHAPLRTRAVAIGERLGIYRDYPVSKGCTSPFAPVWIGEMVRRKEQG